MMYNNMSLGKNSIILMGGRGLAFLISLILPLFLVRIFIVEEYGEYRQVMLLITTAAMILPCGMMNSLYYFLPHYPDEKNIYLSRSIAVIIIACSLILCFIWLLNDSIASYFNNSSFIYYSPLCGLVASFLVLSLIIETVLIIEKEVFLSVKILTVSRVIRGFTIILVSVFWGVSGVLYGLIIWYSLKSILSFYYLKKKYKISYKKIQLKKAAPQFKYSFPVAIGGIVNHLYEIIDKFIVSHYLGVKVFAVYSIGCYEIPLIAVVFQSIGDVVLPRLVILKSKVDTEGVFRLWHEAIEKSFLVGMPLFTFLLIFTDDIIITFFTAKYVGAVLIFKISIISILLESTRYGAIIRAYAKTWFTLYMSIASLIIMIPLCFYGVKSFGMIGAVCSVIFSRAIVVISELIYSKYLLKLKWRQFLPFKKLSMIGIASIVSVILTYIFSLYLNDIYKIIKIFIILFTFSSCYLYCTKFMNLWELESLPIPEKLKNCLIIKMFPNTYLLSRLTTIKKIKFWRK
ncbi:membrane hypothetical protein [Candidatus Magnetomoraceae bacterium gMMP-15]